MTLMNLAFFKFTFLDFNLCDIKASQDHKHVASMYYGATNMHFGWVLSEGDDFESLYYVLLTLAGVRLPWLDYKSDREVVMHKLRTNEVEVNEFIAEKCLWISLFHICFVVIIALPFLSIEPDVSGQISRFS